MRISGCAQGRDDQAAAGARLPKSGVEIPGGNGILSAHRGGKEISRYMQRAVAENAAAFAITWNTRCFEGETRTRNTKYFESAYPIFIKR